MNKELLRLFNSIKVDSKNKWLMNFYSKTIPLWFVFDDSAAYVANDSTIKEVSEVIWISWEKANNTFHKSWKVIEDTPQEELWLQAMIHYMTTYWFEELGIFDTKFVFIPKEKLEVPEAVDMKLTVVHWLTEKEILEKVIELAGSWIALMQETLDDLMVIIKECKFPSSIIQDVKNRELKSLLNKHFWIVPNEPVEYLRYVIAELTWESLIIKNGKLIDQIKKSDSVKLDALIKKAPKNLSSIFLRYKPLFLAMKSISDDKTFFNKLRKDAIKTHKPIWEDYLNTITKQIFNWTISFIDFESRIKTYPIFRKIRLAYALKYRTNGSNSIVYKIRNWKSYATDTRKWSMLEDHNLSRALDETLSSIIQDLSHLNWKTIYIPDYMNYTLPATEKQFVWNFPVWSYIEVGNDMVFGIHWENLPIQRVDLDLSTLSISGKVGWNRSYTSSDGSVLFSWDITDAPKPKGATELFYVKKEVKDTLLVMVNYFSHQDDSPVPTKIIVWKQEIRNTWRHFVIDPNNIIFQTNVIIEDEQSFLWLVKNVAGKNRYYLTKSSIWNSIVSGNWPVTEKSREYFEASLVDSIDLRTVFALAWAIIVNEIPEYDYIDLSPENIDKTTIINLLLNK